jgi:hypothetical protein
MSSMDHQDYLALRRWFFETIKARKIDHRSEPFSYDANSAYDYAHYRLQVEARADWLTRYGYAPTDEMLSRAFFDAEIERYTRARDWRNPLRWLRRYLTKRRAAGG